MSEKGTHFTELPNLVRYKITCTRRSEISKVTTEEPTIVCPICYGLILQKEHCMTAIKLDDYEVLDVNYGKWKPRKDGVQSKKTIERARRETAEMRGEKSLVAV